jgi:hypothetical protein
MTRYQSPISRARECKRRIHVVDTMENVHLSYVVGSSLECD